MQPHLHRRNQQDQRQSWEQDGAWDDAEQLCADEAADIETSGGHGLPVIAVRILRFVRLVDSLPVSHYVMKHPLQSVKVQL